MSWRLIGVLSCALVLSSGPGAWAQPAAPPAPEPRPIVFLLEGVGGIDLIDFSAEIGFGSAKLPHEVRRFYWSHGFGRWLQDLQDYHHLLTKSEELAQEIQALKKEEPRRRIYIVAHSGGTGVAVRAVERLPANSIDRMILLSSALSPGHDLRPALRACKGGLISFHSRHDYFILHWGTSQFGTIDRHYQPSAGYSGFAVPGDLSNEDRKLYSRLVQIPWSSRMIWQGNFGNHSGPVFPSFLAGDVAHWLR